MIVLDTHRTPRCPQTQSRQSSRHRVELPCEVVTSASDTLLLMWATDMSASGLWLEAERPLELGEPLVICFQPGIWWHAKEIQVFAEVNRISRGKRGPGDRRGMGLSFLDLTQSERWQLRCWLRPRPEPRAHRRSLESERRFQVPNAVSPAFPAMMSASPFAARIN